MAVHLRDASGSDRLRNPLTQWYDDPSFWVDRLLHPADRDWCVGFCSMASRACRNHAFLYRARKADGSVLWIKDVVRVIPGEEGLPNCLRGLMLVVSDEDGEREHLQPMALDYDAPELEVFRAALAA